MPNFVARLLVAWAATVVIETAVLGGLLSRRHDMRVRLFAGAWLSLSTLPLAWLVLPDVLPPTTPPTTYAIVVETTVTALECGLFWWAFVRPLPRDRRATAWDVAAITLANLASYGIGIAGWRLAGGA